MMKLRKKSVYAGLLMLLMAVMVYSVALAATTIDDFDTGDGGGNMQFVCIGSFSICTLNSANSVSGVNSFGNTSRDLRVTRTSATGSMFLTVDEEDNNRAVLILGDAINGTAEIVWDNDTNATTLTPTLNNISFNPDLGFLVSVLSSDHPASIRVRIYDDATNYSELSRSIPTDIAGRTDFFFPYSSFTATGTGMNLSDVGAVQVLIDATQPASASLDISLDIVESTSVLEFGDLPADYGALVMNASHIPGGLRLGSRLDSESAHQPDVAAAGDDVLDDPTRLTDDEDGVVRTPGVNWAPVNGGGSLNVVVNGCPVAECRLSGWIDWNGNDSFADPGDQIFNDRQTGNGNHTIPFNIPGTATPANGNFYARFRICSTATACNTVSAVGVADGEVEDYWWEFGPTAVSMQNISTATTNPANWVGALALVLAVVTTGAVVVRRRQPIA